MSEPATDAWPLDRLLSEVIGAGPKSAVDMTRTQAREAFERILTGETDPTTLGAFLLANRWKGNTPVELAAFVDVMCERSVRSATPSVPVVDCGANYDGKRRTALLGVAAGIVSAAAGTGVAIHSGDRVPTKQGCTYKHVLDELGVPTDLSPEASAAMIDDVGIGFYAQPQCNPGVHALLDRREQMGVRTFINTIETLANPANASVHVGSFYHLTFAKKVVDTIAESDQLAFERVIMIQGLEGYDDVRPGHTTLAEWEDGTLREAPIETADFGLAFEEDDLVVDDVATDSARITHDVLAERRSDHFADAIALNAAVRLYAGSTVDTIEDGLALARGVIDDGEAADRLDQLRAFEPATPARSG